MTKKKEMSLKKVQQFLDGSAGDLFSDGSFKETMETTSGQQVTFSFAFATGMAWIAKQGAYKTHFGILPAWVLSLHPMHRIQICDLAIRVGEKLPDLIDSKTIDDYATGMFSPRVQQLHSQGQQKKSSVDVKITLTKAKNMKSQAPITDFTVDDSGTWRLENFVMRETRSEFYESVSDFWYESPTHLTEAMDECQPLAWAVHEIYTCVREEIKSDLDRNCGDSLLLKRYSALKARLETMPEEPEEGVEAWLLLLTTSEFEEHVVPEIEEWFKSPPNWNFEDDYLPKDSTSQGAALKFFSEMAALDLDAISVDIIEGDHPGSTNYAAELRIDVNAANKAAEDAGIPVRFSRGTA